MATPSSSTSSLASASSSPAPMRSGATRDRHKGKIINEVKERIEQKKPFYSFEFFPPKTEAGVVSLYKRLDRMALLHPLFMDVTWGAGGSTADLTLEISSNAQNYSSAEVMMHLTCTNIVKEKVEEALEKAKAAGIRNILALRGDPPKGQDEWEVTEGGFAHAADLVRFIRQKYGDYFCIAVAGYPEGHMQSESLLADVRYLKAKLDAGADLVITQLFYDCDRFFQWVDLCRAEGITAPIIPGILPIQNFGAFTRMTTFCKTYVPPEISAALEPIKEDDAAVKDYGIKLGIEMSRKLLDGGVPGLHFYTLNLELSVIKVLEGLRFITTVDENKKLPWKPSVLAHRQEESVRPIYWAQRPESYLSRTANWDEFPNGRYGDHRSAAFGDLRDYHLCNFSSGSPAERQQLWGAEHDSDASIFEVFAGYVEGRVARLPWCETPPQAETSLLRERLVKLCRAGFLTINSQPAVNGAPSEDPLLGWGQHGGYVFQKAYLEFFCSPAQLDRIIAALARFSHITYHAVNKAGESRTNSPARKVNAVTWGVFPNAEIAQPTVTDPFAFEKHWVPEAFALFEHVWADIYPKGSRSRELLQNMYSSYWLINVVDNDFVKGDIWAPFAEILNL